MKQNTAPPENPVKTVQSDLDAISPNYDFASATINTQCINN